MEEGRTIKVRSQYLSTQFDLSGNLMELKCTDSEGDSVIRKAGPAFDLVVDGRLFFGQEKRRVCEIRQPEAEQSVCFIYEKAGLLVMHEVTADKDKPCLRQKVCIQCKDGGLRKLTAVHYYISGMLPGNGEDCLVQAPGQVIAADSPYGELAQKPLSHCEYDPPEPLPWYPQGWLEPAPDQTSGLVAVENQKIQRIVSVWQYSEIATVFPTINGDGQYIDVIHRHQLCAWLKPGTEVVSEGHCVLLTKGTWLEHLEHFRKVVYEGQLASVTDIPGWFSEARLLQIDPRPLSDWRARLDYIRDIGFTLLYLMPVWSNQGNVYALMDHYKLDDRKPGDKFPDGGHRDPHANCVGVGSEDELKDFVRAAHGRGLRVLFDFIPQGIGVLSPFVNEHPDWLVRDELERPFASHGWGPGPGAPAGAGTYSLDWGNPDYRKYAIDWAVWNLRTFDIDGFRTDAMHWKEPNFSLRNPRPAWETMFGGIRMLEELRSQMKKVKPEAVLLSEVWGPVFQRSHDATYENGWLVTRVNRGWLKGEPVWSGLQWTRYLADSRKARPEGLIRANYSCNHDSQDIGELARTSPMGDTVSFVHMFSDGIPFIWHKELYGREAYFREAIRQRNVLAGYRCCYRSIQGDSPELFTAVWTRQDSPTIVAVANLSMKDVRARIHGEIVTGSPGIIYGSNILGVERLEGAMVLEFAAAGYGLVQLN